MGDSDSSGLPVVTHWVDGKPYDVASERLGDVYDPATGRYTAHVSAQSIHATRDAAARGIGVKALQAHAVAAVEQDFLTRRPQRRSPRHDPATPLRQARQNGLQVAIAQPSRRPKIFVEGELHGCRKMVPQRRRISMRLLVLPARFQAPAVRSGETCG